MIRLRGPLVIKPHETPSLDRPSELGLAALQVAITQIGQGEQGGNNRGPALDRYRRGCRYCQGGAWCAVFALWCYEEGARNLGIELPWPSNYVDFLGRERRIASAKLLARTMLRHGGYKVVDRPHRGDLMLKDRGQAPWQGHVGIVSYVEPGNSLFHAIAGNVGRFPSEVRDYPHELGEPGLLYFVRPPLGADDTPTTRTCAPGCSPP
jgi:hypothetical protein